VQNAGNDDMTPPRSLVAALLPFGCGGRYRLTKDEITRSRSSQESQEKDAALPFFHRLRPLTSITKSDAQISGGETRQDYKDPRRFPW
jgi:hypothetical protein